MHRLSNIRKGQGGLNKQTDKLLLNLFEKLKQHRLASLLSFEVDWVKERRHTVGNVAKTLQEVVISLTCQFLFDNLCWV